MKKRVLLRGPFLTQSGYGVHGRQLARWILNRPDLDVTVQALPWGGTPWCLRSDDEKGLIGQIMSRCSPLTPPYDVTVQVQLPNEFDVKLGRFNVGVTASVETDKCNPSWVTACNTMDRMIVPSEFTKSNITSSGTLTKPIVVVNESFNDACALDDADLPLEFTTFSTSFNFLVFGQLTGNNPHNDRKNTFNTLKWLFEEFKDDDDVGIVLKTNAGRNSLQDRDVVKQLLSQLIKETRKTSSPRVHLLHGEMSDIEVAALYRNASIKALLTATRGEGYGLPILEAAASGLPVIATDWSGHTEFLKHGKFVSLQFKLQDIHSTRIDNQIFMPGTRWAEVNEVDFKKKVRKFKNSPAIPSGWASDLQKKILELYSFEAISRRYDEVLGDVL